MSGLGTTMHESPLNDLHFFDVENNTWHEVLKPDDTFPMERSFHQMVSVGKSLFIFGGCGKKGRMSDLHEFNTETSKWIKHTEIYSVSIFSLNTRLFVCLLFHVILPMT